MKIEIEILKYVGENLSLGFQLLINRKLDILNG